MLRRMFYRVPWGVPILDVAQGVDAVGLLQTLQAQAERFGAIFKACTVTSVDLSCRPFKVRCNGHEQRELTTSSLIVATGASARWLGAPGERALLSRGVHTCATCDGYFYKGRSVAVIGGGDTACEQALFLARLASDVTVVHRRGAFRASKVMAARTIAHPNIKVLWNTTVNSFEIGDNGKAGGARVLRAIRLHQRRADEEGIDTELEVSAAFVAIGHVPTTQLFEGALAMSDEGYILTIPGSMRTSVVGVYAAGDVQDSIYRQAITSAGTGAQAALDAERWLCQHGC